ncbi:MAG TPA: GspE/PulE family protein [Polyangiaceae bacterium]|jgi:general secretion pathway protein E|nr:GspE/PulE family protein [Polyangiaceae bacterium]
MQPARQIARPPVSFDELLGWLAQEGLIDTSIAQGLFDRQERELARLVHERRITQKLPQGSEPQIAASVTPIELFLHFNLKDRNGQPFREDQLTEIYARRIGLPYEKLDPLELDAEFITGVFSKPFARKHNLLALADLGAALKVATYNPFDTWALESVERITGKSLELVIASKSDIQRLITEFYGFRSSVKRAEHKLSQSIDLGNLEQFVRMKTEREIEASDEHVIHAVEYLFSYAFQERASDIHIEPKRNDSVVRYRIDGSLREVNRLPRVVHNAVINRIKTLARLDIGEKRRPQDGRIKTEWQSKAVEIRVSTLSVAFGEKVVLRIFDPDIVHDDLGQLGFSDREREIFERLVYQPHGIILVTGPTGSGKTTTLYTALRKRASDDINITTIEDPIEMVFDKINQTAINPTIGLGFSESLRTLLRQDPDIIMVGEIRDLDTARYAIQAALTGHLVFSTLHTNDAPSAVTRLLDLGAENFLLASTLSALIAQRLVKKVCASCAMERLLTDEETAEIAPALPPGSPAELISMYGTGCVECRQSGFVGRCAVYEVFELSDTLRKLIMQRADATLIKKQARIEGMRTLREAAVAKMLERVTSFEEVVSVTRPD